MNIHSPQEQRRRISRWYFALAAISGLMALLAAPGAFAQVVPVDPNQVSFTPNNTDVSIGLLQAILGNWKSMTPDPTMGAFFRAFNLGVLVFGACLFIYASTVGIMHSAEDGEILGRKWGSMFVPLRMTGGMVLLYPLANGFSGIQLAVL